MENEYKLSVHDPRKPDLPDARLNKPIVRKLNISTSVFGFEDSTVRLLRLLLSG